MFTQRSGEVEGCTSSTCCYCRRSNEHRKQKFVLLALLLSAQRIKERAQGSIHLPPLSGFNVKARVNFTQGCETEKRKWMNPSALGSPSKFLWNLINCSNTCDSCTAWFGQSPRTAGTGQHLRAGVQGPARPGDGAAARHLAAEPSDPNTPTEGGGYHQQLSQQQPCYLFSPFWASRKWRFQGPEPGRTHVQHHLRCHEIPRQRQPCTANAGEGSPSPLWSRSPPAPGLRLQSPGSPGCPTPLPHICCLQAEEISPRQPGKMLHSRDCI